MFGDVQRLAGADGPPEPRWAIAGSGLAVMAVLIECATIVYLAMVSCALYHLAAYGSVGDLWTYAALGALIAVFFTLQFLYGDAYRVRHLISAKRGSRSIFAAWNLAFVLLALIGFLTKSSDQISRVALLLFYATGLAGMIGVNFAFKQALQALLANGRVQPRRLLLVGTKQEIEALADKLDDRMENVHVAATAVLNHVDVDSDKALSPLAIKQALDGAVARARLCRVDDVVILTDWSHDEVIREAVEAFTTLPVSIHLGAGKLLSAYSNARVSNVAKLTALSLTAPPLGPLQIAAKRAFDVFVSALALFLLSPLFLAIAAAIRLTSRGPVFFRQRRRGYNQEEFRIWKFRTMSTMDDGDVIVQATANDARVTRVGSYLRRFNLDELPQLINVLMGNMSLVGPRPHAVAHDRLFEQMIRAYPRRLNVKPGMTGWAQVNGHRGVTQTDDAIRLRVDHDLYYIDNWSLALDLYIMLLTVSSPKAFRNAA